MAYLPVEFDLHDFQLSLNTMQSANFHKRLKELGFDSNQHGDVLTYGRGKSRITAFVVNGAELNFLPDFYDDTPGGTVYAIMEKMCVAFGGTMIGQYSVPSLGKTWDVRISGGLNLSGRPDVGQRDHVVEEDDGSSPSSSSGGYTPQPTQQAPAQRVAKAPKQANQTVSNGEVQEGQSRESTRDKVYKILVETRYENYVKEFGEDTNVLFGFIREFNEQFPKEEETQQAKETQIDQGIIDALYQFVSLDESKPLSTLAHEIHLLEQNGEEIVTNVADQYGFGEDEVEEAVDLLVSQYVSSSQDDEEDDDFWDEEDEL